MPIWTLACQTAAYAKNAMTQAVARAYLHCGVRSPCREPIGARGAAAGPAGAGMTVGVGDAVRVEASERVGEGTGERVGDAPSGGPTEVAAVDDGGDVAIGGESGAVSLEPADTASAGSLELVDIAAHATAVEARPAGTTTLHDR
jgi:hypothetical protein